MLPSSRRRPRALAAGVLLGAALAACAAADAGVVWSAQATVAAPAGPVALTAGGALVPDTLARMGARVTPPAGPLCPGSLRLASSGSSLYGVWWAPRGDGGARLLAARSADEGRTWSVPSPVDTTDRAVTGCRREVASIAADAASGYVHVAYALQALEGPGLFFAHSMDEGVTFHSPVPILYGERLGRTSVAADGDHVVVAFEDPNSRRPRIGLALSRTMGHIFERRVIPLSDDNGVASHPLAAVRGGRVAVAWEQGSAAEGSATPAWAVRVGELH